MIHGNKYDYRESNFTGTKKPIKIYCNTCQKHFHQEARYHLIGCGCPVCAKNNSINISFKQFIKNSTKIHGNKYNYDQVQYINLKAKVKIYCNTCKKHFWQKPMFHIKGHGCPTCWKNQARSNTKEFIQKATKIHGNKYNYDKVNYITAKLKIKIYCNTCKKYFYQKPNDHLTGSGCKKCTIQNKRSNIKEFIQKATKIHDNKYNYSQTKYVNCMKKIKIYCNTCKKYFYQKPNTHLNGVGCKKCAIQNKRSNTKEFIKKAIKIHGNKYDYNQTIYRLLP